MTKDYWMAELLSIAVDQDKLVIRLEQTEKSEANYPVVQLQLKGGNFTSEVVALLKANLFDEIEICFQENDSHKYLELNTDYSSDPELRLEYTECERQETPYRVDELTAKLTYVRRRYDTQLDEYWEENKKLRGILHRLRQEIGKEIDRLERKRDFFAGTEKAARFDEKFQSYQRILDWVDRLERDDAT